MRPRQPQAWNYWQDQREAEAGRALLLMLIGVLTVAWSVLVLLWRIVRRMSLLLLFLLVVAFVAYLVVFGLQHGYIYPAHHS